MGGARGACRSRRRDGLVCPVLYFFGAICIMYFLCCPCSLGCLRVWVSLAVDDLRAWPPPPAHAGPVACGKLRERWSEVFRFECFPFFFYCSCVILAWMMIKHKFGDHFFVYGLDASCQVVDLLCFFQFPVPWRVHLFVVPCHC